MSTPTFAVVGHPNKGKSSIVATLAEDEQVAISAVPGTTRAALAHTLTIDGQPQYALVDTPGFQRPGELLEWLRSHSDSASDRPDAVTRFVEQHADDSHFRDEYELLRPIVEGAGILYVVDGAKPYGPEYELEMEILQWTGRPRMALINMIGPGDHTDAWQQALGQYFSIVRVFDPMHGDFDKRVSLLRAFCELDESWRGQLESAIDELSKERRRRQTRSAREIASCLADCLTTTERAPIPQGDAPGPHRQRMTDRLMQRIRKREQIAFERVAAFYRHQHLDREIEATQLLADDLFTEENWEVFGLSQRQLAVTGVVSGAVAGGGVDLLLGGASLLLGTGIGAVVGGVTGWFGSGELARAKVLGGPLGDRVLQVGPVAAQNFPWVLLGRAWLHQHLVAERNHAYRDALVLALSSEQNLMDAIAADLRRNLARSLRRVERGGEAFESLTAEIDLLLSHMPVRDDN